MYRFSREKRFGRLFCFREFKEAAEQIQALVLEVRPHAKSKVLCTPDADTFSYSRVTVPSAEKIAALKQRKEFTIAGFTEIDWQTTLQADLYVKDSSRTDCFMISMGVNKFFDPKSMKFYGQNAEQSLTDLIHRRFGRANLFHRIGDGLPKHTLSPSRFLSGV